MSLIVATLRFVLKRAWYRRAILLPTVLGLLGVVTALAEVPLFSFAGTYLGLQAATHQPGPAVSNNLEIRLEGEPLDTDLYNSGSAALTTQLQTSLGASLLPTAPYRAGLVSDLNLFPVGSDHLKAPPLDSANLWFSGSMDTSHLLLTQGRFPSATILNFGGTSQGAFYDVEAMIAPEWAAVLHLKLNDVLEVVNADPLGPPDDRGQRHFTSFLRIHIVGFFEPKNLQDPAWFDDLDPFTPPLTLNDFAPPPLAPIWLNEGIFESTAFRGISSVDYIWFYYLNLDAITPDNATTITHNLIQLKNTLHVADINPYAYGTTGLTVLTSLNTTLGTFLQQNFYANSIILVVIVPGVALLLLYLGTAATSLAWQSRPELALMQSRGASRWQVFLPALAEALLLCLGTLLVGPLLAGGLTLLLIRIAFSSSVLSHVHLNLALPALSAYRYAGLAALLCFLVLLLPILQVTQTNLLTVKRRTSRPRLFALPLRLGPGLLLTALGFFGYVEMQQRGAFFLQSLQANQSFDWVAITAPTLLLVGITGLSLLLLPPALRLFDRLARRLPGVAANLASRTLARQSGRYSGLIFLLTLTIALTTFTGLCYGTLNTNLDDRAAFLSGADLRLEEGSANLPEIERQAAPLEDHLRLLPGVTDGMEVLRYDTPPIYENTTATATFLALDSASFARVAYWRSDFADDSLDTLMRALRAAPQQGGALPALVSDQLLSHLNRHIGDQIHISLPVNNGGNFPLQVVGTFHYFPTIDLGQNAIICDLTRLLSSINQGDNHVLPNEVWLKLAPNTPQYNATQVEQRLLNNPQHQQVRVTINQAFDRAAIAASLRADPLQSAIFGMLALDLLIAALLSVVGLALLLYLIARQRTFEFGVLRVMGLSLRQLTGALGWEQLILFVSALLVGVPLGAWIATVVLPALAYDENGQPLFPPITFQLNVPQTLQEGGLLCVCLLAALGVTALLFRRLRVHEVLRLGEE